MLSAFPFISLWTVQVVIYILLTHSEKAGVRSTAINHYDVVWCTAGDLQRRTAPEWLPCGNALFFWLLVAACRLERPGHQIRLRSVLGKACKCRVIFVFLWYPAGEHGKHNFHGSRAALYIINPAVCLRSVSKGTVIQICWLPAPTAKEIMWI